VKNNFIDFEEEAEKIEVFKANINNRKTLLMQTQIVKFMSIILKWCFHKQTG
jgi:hypothetical protein